METIKKVLIGIGGFVVLMLVLGAVLGDAGNDTSEPAASDPELAEAAPVAPTPAEPPPPVVRGDGYKGTSWGMSTAQVMRITGASRLDSGDLALKGEVAGIEATTQFAFLREGPLALIAIDFNETHLSPDMNIEDYEKISELLESKYGKPTHRKVKTDDIFKKRKDWGTGLFIGKVSFLEEWATDDTKIVHWLKGGDMGGVTHRVHYTGIDLADRMEAQIEAGQMGDL